LEEEPHNAEISHVNRFSQAYGVPLYAAYYSGQFEVMDLLLEAGVDIA